MLAIKYYYDEDWDAIKGDTPLSEEEFRHRMDVLNDNKLDMKDVLRIANYSYYAVDTFPVCSAVPPPTCTEGAHEVLEYCPDGTTEKRWRDCINGEWVYNSQTCPGVPPVPPEETWWQKHGKAVAVVGIAALGTATFIYSKIKGKK